MDDLERVGTIKFEEFFRDFLEANQPCVFSSDVTEHWRSRQEWVIDRRPDFEFLSKEFGNFNLHCMLPQKFFEKLKSVAKTCFPLC